MPVALERTELQLSLALKRLVATTLTDAELELLAYERRQGRPQLVARRGLSVEKREELAVMLLAGRRPTAGWWRRARRQAALELVEW